LLSFYIFNTNFTPRYSWKYR